MTDVERKTIRRLLENAWREARAEYAAVGAPFGPGRGLEIWIEFEQRTTVN